MIPPLPSPAALPTPATGRHTGNGTGRMAETQRQNEMAKVEAQDILVERQHGWDFFLRATSWGIGIVAVLLVVVYLAFGRG